MSKWGVGSLQHEQQWIDYEQDFIVFGAGQLGSNLMHILQHYGSFLCFVDNDAKKQKEGWLGNPVLSLKLCIQRYKGYKIILACSVAHREEIERQLSSVGLIARVDFLYIDDFTRMIMPAYVLKHFQENYMSLAQICVTERCTLKCKKCAHGCYNVPRDSNDMALSLVKYSADCFFSHIDYIDKFHLIGGEPFLYKKLVDAIVYIGENYGRQIQNLCVTTNGTIIPKDDVLLACKKYHVLVLISNYTYSLPKLEKQYEKLTQVLADYGIDYILGEADKEWTDYGFGSVDRKLLGIQAHNQEAQTKLREIFSACGTRCREVRGNKLYYCVQARACADNLGFDVGHDDYLDLGDIGDSYEGKKELADFEMGKIGKGYLDMCNYCHGAERFQYVIPAAEQGMGDND